MHVFSAIPGVAIAAVMALAAPARAYTADELSATFDQSDLIATEKRFLQFGLALDGHYSALIDGAWGSGSQRALEDWVRGVDMDLPVKNWEVVVLAMETAERIRSEGWEQRYFSQMDVSLAMPTDWLREVPAVDGEISYAHKTSSLAYVLSAASFKPVSDIHALLLTAAASGTTPYTLRHEKVMITSVIKGDGTTLYLRSDLGRAGWSSVLLAAEKQDRNLLYAVAGSISKGSAGRFELPANGEITEGMGAVAAILAQARPSGAQAYASLGALPQSIPSAPQAAGGDLQSSGTAFYVSEQGHLLTNAHVVKGCGSLIIDGRPVRVLATDAGFDLALLQDIPRQGGAIATFATQPAALNADITVAGYPLSGILSGLNITRGAVSSLKGVGGDAISMQISAPVQPGNSGGPAVDAEGWVVGVVVSKLNATQVAQSTGDIPQNVNFAIRGEMAKLFMFQNGVEPIMAEEGSPPLDPVTLGKKLEAITRLVECYPGAM